MSTIPSTLPGASSTSTGTNAAQRFSDDIDDFLKIFITQLNNQDPLEPFETSDFVQQIANMSEVEQSINSNKKLDKLISQNSGKDTSGLVSFIGKEVEIESQAITLEEGKATSISYNLDPAAMPADVFVTVRKLDGTIIFNGAGTQNQGRNNVSWDGTMNDGHKAGPGIYEVFVTVPDGEENQVKSIPTLVRGRVIGANLDAEKPSLVVNGADIPLDEVKFIAEPGTIG